MTVERVGVSFEPDLLVKFDAHIEAKGYPNRSEAIRDLVRKSLIERKIDTDEKSPIFGTLTFIYDHHSGNAKDRLMHIQHHHVEEILSTTHIHLDKNLCLEVLIVRGMAGEVKKLADNILAVKGVKHGGLVITGTKF